MFHVVRTVAHVNSTCVAILFVSYLLHHMLHFAEFHMATFCLLSVIEVVEGVRRPWGKCNIYIYINIQNINSGSLIYRIK